MLFALVLLALSGLSMAEVCTKAHYPPDGKREGTPIPISPVTLPAGIREFDINLSNECHKTNFLELNVCDYDVAPLVEIQSFYLAKVTRLGGLQKEGHVYGTYYCS